MSTIDRVPRENPEDGGQSAGSLSPGTPGAPGVGVSTGGTAGQVLTKASAADFATVWANAPGAASTVTALAIAAGVVTIDCSLGDYFTLTLTANVTSILFTNLPGAGKGARKRVEITQGAGPFTVAWPASFKWIGAAPAVSVANGAIDELDLTTFNNGTAWKATLTKAWA